MDGTLAPARQWLVEYASRLNTLEAYVADLLKLVHTPPSFVCAQHEWTELGCCSGRSWQIKICWCCVGTNDLWITVNEDVFVTLSMLDANFDRKKFYFQSETSLAQIAEEINAALAKTNITTSHEV